jgi:sulfur-carrier protein
MSIKVKVPTMMLKLTGRESEISVKAKTVRDMVDQLDKKYPGVKGMMLSADGKIHHHFLICINDEDVRFLEGLDSVMGPDDRVEIVASIAGGSGSGAAARGYSRFSVSSTI